MFTTQRRFHGFGRTKMKYTFAYSFRKWRLPWDGLNSVQEQTDWAAKSEFF